MGTPPLAMGDRKGGEQEKENRPVDDFPCERPAIGWPGWLRLQGRLHAQIYCKQSSMRPKPARTSCAGARRENSCTVFFFRLAPMRRIKTKKRFLLSSAEIAELLI